MRSEFWIVSALPVQELPSFDEAETLRATMQRHVPEKLFAVFRCKRWKNPAHHFSKMVELLKEIVAAGGEITPEPRILLGTIQKRSETPHLRPNFSVPEFDPKEVHRS